MKLHYTFYIVRVTIFGFLKICYLESPVRHVKITLSLYM